MENVDKQNEPLNIINKNFIAHVRESDGSEQLLYDHLTGTAQIAKALATKIGLPLAGELIGLLHDLGKYSQAFQVYIQQCVTYDRAKAGNGTVDDDFEALELQGKPARGSVDHSTAGAIFLYNKLKKLSTNTTDKQSNLKIKVEQGVLLADILFICVASHHSGLVNVVDKVGKPYLNQRKHKEEDQSHYQEAVINAIDEKLFTKLNSDIFTLALKEFIKAYAPILGSRTLADKQKDFYTGFYTRLLFSCLIDADRSNSIAFEHPNQAHLLTYHQPNWQTAIDKLEAIYQAFSDESPSNPPNPINDQRNRIAQTCFDAGQKNQGIYSLTVPTGGGKTLASLRFALQHAKRHDLDRIIYIIPFTSIIEQNAAEIRKILEGKLPDGSYLGDWVLEQHSNLEPDVQTWQSKLIMDNWNAPIVFTTMVQFLESCFGGGTKGVRRLHQLSRAVLIFDEIQTLPINCYYLFCNTINFLTSYANSTAVLCTATQPVLDNLPNKKNGTLNTPTEIIGERQDLSLLFDTLKRVDIHDHTQPDKDLDGLTSYILDNFTTFESTLVIVNTKVWASQLYQTLSEQLKNTETELSALFHLSTGQCARHRKDLLSEIRGRLKQGLPTLVVSTQLIEAGVDVSFKSVIRFLAGLDSIAQAAGRCNRHGEMLDDVGEPIKGQVFIVSPDKENLSKLPTIELGRNKMADLLYSLSLPENQDKHLLDPDIMTSYFEYFYTESTIEQQMAYPVKDLDSKQSGSDTIYGWLSSNPTNEYVNNDNSVRLQNKQYPKLWQSFMDAGRAFKAIDAPTQAIVVPYGEAGRELINDLHGTQVSTKDFYKLVREAQQYSVNVFPYMLQQLQDVKAIAMVRDTGILTLDEQFYDDKMGLDISGSGELDFLGGF
ncbi:CRISPR-associated helicase Cas3' [Psychrobacter sp. CAL346-MNA-CIBAN-0220]|uniref:CRISPR-associated helicase Cas3' n=1 Tax=Psychrobacter sp. CAL346-MNA-CIBAN-0220 TaxID=3140457 RepID=UPI003328AA69